MFFTYKPEGQEEQRWHFQPGKMRSQEAESIQQRTGMPYGSDFKMALLKGDMLARRGLLWAFLRRQHPSLRFEDVDFADEEVQLELDKDEVRAEMEALADAPGISDADRKIAEAIFAEQLKTAPEPPGKAESKDSEKSTA